MSDERVRRFLASYSPADGAAIRFAWNGGHGEAFSDANRKFREAVLDAVLDDLDAAPLELARDLYRAETRCSREDWGISDGVGRLAERLLRRGDDRYIDDFLDGKFQGFDASLGSAFDVDLPLAERLLGVVRERLKAAAGDEAERLKAGEDFFQDRVEYARSQGN